MTTTTTGQDWRELAQRHADGLQVTLLWSHSADRVKVAVADLRHGGSFDVPVPPAAALDAFAHPFAYAA